MIRRMQCQTEGCPYFGIVREVELLPAVQPGLYRAEIFMCECGCEPCMGPLNPGEHIGPRGTILP